MRLKVRQGVENLRLTKRRGMVARRDSVVTALVYPISAMSPEALARASFLELSTSAAATRQPSASLDACVRNPE